MSVVLVKLKFSRVQSYLFSVPELKVMIGANALLGEVLRGRLDGDEKFVEKLGIRKTDHKGQSIDNFPALAVKCGAKAPSRLNLEDLSLPDPDNSDDPLNETSDSVHDRDDPGAAWANGVLIRDAGTLHAVFPHQTNADEFIHGAIALTNELLPGLDLKAEKVELCFVEDRKIWREQPSALPVLQQNAVSSTELPQFQVCEASGQGVANTAEKYWDYARGKSDSRQVSDGIARKIDRSAAFGNGKTKDILGLLMRPFIQSLGQNREARVADLFPRDFQKVAPSGYLAVIVADGNGMGSRSREWLKKDTSEDYFQRMAHGEKFFHAMRTIVRRSVKNALAVFKGTRQDQYVANDEDTDCEKREVYPFRLLMLGGDDLVLVCDAIHAVRFVVELTKQIEHGGGSAHKLPDEEPLHLGIGMVMVKHTFPFHRAHSIAEQLAGSAKRLYRDTQKEQRGSTIDWISISDSWAGDVSEIRQKEAVIKYRTSTDNTETLVLSAKPYRVLAAGQSSPKPGFASLEELWIATDGSSSADLRSSAATSERVVAARNKLKSVAESIPTGRRQADRVLREAPEEVRAALKPILHSGEADEHKSDSLWRLLSKDEDAKSKKEDVKDRQWLTHFLDFLELAELRRRLNAEQQKRAALNNPSNNSAADRKKEKRNA